MNTRIRSLESKAYQTFEQSLRRSRSFSKLALVLFTNKAIQNYAQSPEAGTSGEDIQEAITQAQAAFDTDKNGPDLIDYVLQSNVLSAVSAFETYLFSIFSDYWRKYNAEFAPDLEVKLKLKDIAKAKDLKKVKEAVLERVLADVQLLKLFDSLCNSERFAIKGEDAHNVRRIIRVRNLYSHRDGMLDKNNIKKLRSLQLKIHDLAERFLISVDQCFDWVDSLKNCARAIDRHSPEIDAKIMQEFLEKLLYGSAVPKSDE